MSFQAIINTAQRIEFNRRKVVGQTISRSQRIKTQERLTGQPFTLTVTPLARFKFENTRAALELIQNYDRTTECQIQLSQISGLSYITSYTGDLSQAQRSALTITNFTATSVTIGGLPSTITMTATNLVFKAGDWIQPQGSRYPYIVTGNVIRGTGTVVTATVHRPLISSEGISLTGTPKVGTETTMVVVASEFPTYSLVSRDWAQYDGDFVFVERII